MFSRYLPSRPEGHGGHSIVGRGLYFAQISQWDRSFGGDGDGLLVLELSDLFGSKLDNTMAKAFRFLGVDDDFIVADPSVKNKYVLCLL